MFQSEPDQTRLQLPRFLLEDNKQSLVHDRLWILRHTSDDNRPFLALDESKVQMTSVALNRSSVNSHNNFPYNNRFKPCFDRMRVLRTSYFVM